MENPLMIYKDMFNGLRSILRKIIQFQSPYSSKLKKDLETVKAEVQVKKEFSMEDTQELLVKPSMEYSHYIAFVQKFVISMEEYMKCNIALDVKKAHIFNSREENISSQHEAWSKHFQKKGLSKL